MQESISQFIPDEKIREIRDASSIVEVISDYIGLKKVGINHKGLCPFHNEKTPSFYVNEAKRFFHCFGCGTSGDVFAFLMKHDSLSFAEAARHLAKRYGIHLPEKPLTGYERQRLSEREQFFKINESVAGLYHRLLTDDGQAAGARRYLAERGLGGDIIREHCIGFAPDSWDTVVRHLRGTSFPPELAARLGLIIAKDGGRYYDRFRNRIMFPIWNASRQIIGFGGRVIGQGEPKYLNSPESVVYNKRHNLYGIQSAGHFVQKEGRAIIVEGYLDALTLHQAGIKNTVAALGTALTEHQIQLLKRYGGEIVTVFDADTAGEKAMARSLEPFLKNGVSPRVIVLPKGEDPDSFVRQQGGAAFQEKISAAGFLLDFVIERIIARHDIATPRGKVAACDEIAPFLGQIADSLERELYEQQVARRLGLSPAQVRSRGPARAAQAASGAPEPKQSAAGSTGAAELFIVKLLAANPGHLDSIGWDLFKDFTSPGLRDLGLMMAEMYRRTGALDFAQMSDSFQDPGQKRLLAEVSFFENQPEEPLKALEDCIRSLYLRNLADEAKRIGSGIRQAEAARDEDRVRKLQQRHLQLKGERQKWARFTLH